MNLATALEAHPPADLNAPCIHAACGRVYSWKEVRDTTARLTGLLLSLKLPRDARVAVQVEKSPEALFLYLAVLRAGLVYLPLNTAYREKEMAYFLEDAAPSVVVVPASSLSWITPLVPAGAHLLTLEEDGSGSLMEAAAPFSADTPAVERCPDDLAAILYTSGTTGRSKGAMLTHGNLLSNARTLHTSWGWRSDDVLLHALPIFHAHGLFVAAQGALLAGAQMLWFPKFDAREVLAALPRATVMMGVPTFYVRLLADPGLTRERCAGMRLFISGSAPLLAETFAAFRERTGHTILERYGMTETVMLVSNPYDPAQGERLAGTVGMPLPGVEARVVDAAGEPCPPGEIGAIEVRGPNIFKGYWQMPEKTKEEFTADGWFKTGDMGRWGGETAGRTAPDHYLTIVGRSKELIICGGYNVYPKEIEGYINELPGVAESAVFGVRHPDFGEAVAAAVVPQAGAHLDPEAMKETLKSRMANFKAPKQIHLLPELPRNAMGKVQKNVLQEQFDPKR